MYSLMNLHNLNQLSNTNATSSQSQKTNQGQQSGKPATSGRQVKGAYNNQQNDKNSANSRKGMSAVASMSQQKYYQNYLAKAARTQSISQYGYPEGLATKYAQPYLSDTPASGDYQQFTQQPARHRGKQQRRQQQNEINIAQMSQKEFRVFFGLISTVDDLASPVHAKEQISAEDTPGQGDEETKCTAENNPINQKQDIQQQPSDIGLREWFENLTVDERVNALTTTSPYLSEILMQMHRQLKKKGSTLFAQQSQQQKYSYLFDPLVLHQHYSQPYGPQYFKDQNFMSPFENNGEAEDGTMQGGYPAAETPNYPQNFEDSFYCRVQQKNEIDRMMEQEAESYQSANDLVQNLRFCDLFYYLDTVSVSCEFVKDPNQLFSALNAVSGGQSFKKSCQFQYDQKLGIHLIESPDWFKPERFQSLAVWIAAIYEENLWANYQYYTKSFETSQKGDSQQKNSYQYLFDMKEMQDGFQEQLPCVSLHTLANSWLNSSQQQKQKIVDSLKEGKLSLPNQQNNNTQQFFYNVVQFNDSSVKEQDMNELIQLSLKIQKDGAAVATKKNKKNAKKQNDYLINSKVPKYDDSANLIVMLMQSSLDRIHSGKDMIYRTFLKLVQRMHQDQVIQDLLNSDEPISQNSPSKKKKNKKKQKSSEVENQTEKPENNYNSLKSGVQQQVDDINQEQDQNKINQSDKNNQQFNQNKSDQVEKPKGNMSELGLQNSSLRVQQIIQDDKLPIEAEHEEYIEELKRSQMDSGVQKTKQNDSDVKPLQKISNEYVSGILQKIGGNSTDKEEAKDPEQSNEEVKKTARQAKKNKKKKQQEGINLPADQQQQQFQQNSNQILAPSDAQIPKSKKTQSMIVQTPCNNQQQQQQSQKPQDTNPEEQLQNKPSPSKKQKKKQQQQQKELIHQDLPVVTKMQSVVVSPSKTPLVKIEDAPKESVASQASLSSRQKSIDKESAKNQTTGTTGQGRKRQRKKNKTTQQDAMNEFIKNKFQQKRPSEKPQVQHQPHPNSMKMKKYQSFIHGGDDSHNIDYNVPSGGAFSKKNSMIVQHKKDDQILAKNKKNYNKQNIGPAVVKEITPDQAHESKEDKQVSRQQEIIQALEANNNQSPPKQSSYYSKSGSLDYNAPQTSSNTSPIQGFEQHNKQSESHQQSVKSASTANEDHMLKPPTTSSFINTNSPSFKPTNTVSDESAQIAGSFLSQQPMPGPNQAQGGNMTNSPQMQNQQPQWINNGQQQQLPPQSQQQQQIPTLINLSDQLAGFQLGFMNMNKQPQMQSAFGNFNVQQQNQNQQQPAPYQMQQQFIPTKPQNMQQIPNGENQQQQYPQQQHGNDLHQGIQTLIQSATQAAQDRQSPPPQIGAQQSHDPQQVQHVTSYNINQFANLNIGQISNHNFGVPQQMPQYPMQMNYQQQGYHPQQPMMQGNQFMGYNPLQQPMPQMQQQVQYPNQYYDLSMSQNNPYIEYKFFEKFDTDIYDEVNKIQKQLDLTKNERKYLLHKLQKMCEEVFKPCDDAGNRKSNTSSNYFNRNSLNNLSPQKMNTEASPDDNIPKIKQFGSLVTGLALESSDMDMAVTNLNLPNREKMIESLDLFADKLREWDMIQDLNAISTATIPVIKAVVDLNKLREQEIWKDAGYLQESKQRARMNSQDFGQTQNNLTIEESKQQILDEEKVKQLPRIPDHLALLKIDITFDDNLNQNDDYLFGNMSNQGYGQNNIYGAGLEQKSHQGLASCKLIKSYVEEYKCLKEVSIILKLLLAKLGLNSPYHGGISSYSTVLLLVAFMNKWNLKMNPTLTPARLLMSFLDYYSYYFKVSLFGIDVSNDGSFFEHSAPETNFVILDPLNNQDNTTRNSFMTHEILKDFRTAFNSLKSKKLQYTQMNNPNITDNLLNIILNKNDEQNTTKAPEPQKQVEESSNQANGPQAPEGNSAIQQDKNMVVGVFCFWNQGNQQNQNPQSQQQNPNNQIVNPQNSQPN